MMMWRILRTFPSVLLNPILLSRLLIIPGNENIYLLPTSIVITQIRLIGTRL